MKSPPPADKKTSKIHRAAQRAIAKGVENWQINLKIDRHGVSFEKCFALNLFPAN